MNNKQFPLLLIIVILSISLISFSSALEFDNVKSYDAIKKEVTIKNAFGFGDEISKTRLNTPIENKVGLGYQKVAEFELESYKDYEDILKSIDFYDKNKVDWEKNKIERTYDLKFKTYEDVLVYDYGVECSKIKNETEICQQIKKDSHYETKEVWNDLKDFNIKKDEFLVVGIFTEVREGDYVEWIPTLYGVEIKEWATWVYSLNTGLTNYWYFNETSGTIAYDVFGAVNGTNIGATVNVSGIIGSYTAYDFDGSNDKVTFGDNFDFGANNFTINYWAYPQDVTTNDNNIWKGNYGSNGYFSGLNGGGVIDFVCMDGGARRTQSVGSTVVINQWQMVTITKSGSTIRLYKNSTEVTYGQQDACGTISGNSNNFTIGAYGTSDFYDGKLAGFGIWYRALNSTEINSLYGAGTPPLINQSDTPVDNYPSVVLISPSNNTNFTSSSINFIANVTDAIYVQNVSLKINEAIVETNTSHYNGTYSFNYNVLEGLGNWSILACDNSSQCNQSAIWYFNYTKPIDTYPTLILNSPSSTNYTSSPQNVQVNFTAWDNLVLSNVSLYVNRVLNQTNTSGLNYRDYLFNLTLTNGVYNIYGRAVDNSSQAINSSFYLWKEFNNKTFSSLASVSTCLNTINSTRIILGDSDLDKLITLDWNGTGWKETDTKNKVLIYCSLATINSTRIVLTDPAIDSIETLDWNGTTWNIFDNKPFGDITYSSLTALNSTRIVFVNDYANKLITLDWNGTTWDILNNKSFSYEYPYLTNMNSTRIILGYFHSDNYYINTLDWNGTDWQETDIKLINNAVNFNPITKLDNNRLIYWNKNDISLITLDWNGTDWQEINKLSYYAGAINSLTALNSTRIVMSYPLGDIIKTLNLETTNSVTIIIDGEIPSIEVTEPLSNYTLLKTGDILNLNFTATDDSILDSCWWDYNGTNNSISCSNGTEVKTTFAQEEGDYDITVYANDTAGKLNYYTSTWYPTYYQYNITYNSTSSETATENFILNLSGASEVFLNYNGEEYESTKSGNIYTTKVTIPDGDTGNISFYWDIDGEVDTIDYYQNVSYTIFTLCNATYDKNFLNITFKDEDDLSRLNASITTSTFEYYLGDGSVVKEYELINLTDNYEYDFCAYPSDRRFFVDPYMQYKKESNYPQRVWNPVAQPYTNSLTNETLYLLSSTDGQYITFQVTNTADQVLEDVSVNSTRRIDGEDVLVAAGTTDAAGTLTFWLNPDFYHDFSFYKTGYEIYETSFQPTQTEYTIVLGSKSVVVNSTIRGIDYIILPTNSYLENNTGYTFGFSLNSSYKEIDEYGFNLRLANGTIITGDFTDIENTLLTLDYNVNTQKIIYLDAYWEIEGSYVNLTRVWVIQNTAYEGYSIKTFFIDMKAYINSGTGIFGLDDFGVNLIIFFILFISVGIFSMKYGISSPMATSGLIFSIIFLFDVVINIIPTIRGIENLPTMLAGLILGLIALNEVKLR